MVEAAPAVWAAAAVIEEQEAVTAAVAWESGSGSVARQWQARCGDPGREALGRFDPADKTAAAAKLELELEPLSCVVGQRRTAPPRSLGLFRQGMGRHHHAGTMEGWMV